jgi:Na+-transporting NADH:ubiquinone oxidoreductase subunit B
MKDFVEAVLTIGNRFLWSSHTVTRTPPHIRDANNTQRLWNYFVFASVPAWLIGIWGIGYQTNRAIVDFALTEVPGWRAGLLARAGFGFDPFSMSDCLAHGLTYFLPVFLAALLTGTLWEALFAVVRNRRVDEGLLYVAWFLSLILPATVPIYQVVLGMSFGMVFGKLIYGGSGRYLVNPALLALAFLMFSYPHLLYSEGAWVPLAGYDQPTVLELVTDEGGVGVVASVGYSFWEVFFGVRPGSMGTVSAFGALLGALFLVWSGMASWRIMVGALLGLIGMSLLFNAIAPDQPLFSLPWYWHLVLGGFAFGTVFLATDPVAGPITDPGRWGFGILVGALTVLVRVGNPSHYEGIIFAILLASMFSPLIDYVVVQLNIRRRRRRLQEAGHA